TTRPFTNPMNAPDAMPSAVASTASWPPFRSIAVSTDDKARIEPTERSMPPRRITSVMPNAMSALIDTWRMTLNRLPTVRKSRLRPASPMHPTTRATVGPILCSAAFSRGVMAPLVSATAGGGADDLLLVGVLGVEDRRLLALAHDEDPVAHRQDLGKLRRHHH